MFKNLSFLLGVTAACSLLLVATTGPSLATTSSSFMPPCPPEECGPPISTDTCDDGYNCDECAAVNSNTCPAIKIAPKNGETSVCTICGGFCAISATVECYDWSSCTTGSDLCFLGQDQCDLAHGSTHTQTVPGFVIGTTPC